MEEISRIFCTLIWGIHILDAQMSIWNIIPFTHMHLQDDQNRKILPCTCCGWGSLDGLLSKFWDPHDYQGNT